MSIYKKKPKEKIKIYNSNIIDENGSFKKNTFTIKDNNYIIVSSKGSYFDSIWDTIDTIKNIKTKKYIDIKRKILYEQLRKIDKIKINKKKENNEERDITKRQQKLF